MKLALEKLIPAAFILAVGLLITLGIFSYQSVQATNRAIEWEIHTQEVLQKLDRLLLISISAETEMRGYFITRNRDFLDTFDTAEANTNTNIAQLRELLKDNQRQLERLNNLENSIGEKLTFLKSVYQEIEARPDQFSVSGNGKPLMDKIRVITEEMKQVETTLLRERENEVKEAVARTSFLIIVGSVAGIFLLGLANVLIYIENRKRTFAESKLKNVNRDLEERVNERTKNLAESNEALKHSEIFNRATIDSLSAHIAVVNRQGKIVTVNKAWNNFAQENAAGDSPAANHLGVNYLDVCRSSSKADETSQIISEKLEQILDGKLTEYAIEYPCHSKTEKRWFLLNINALQTPEGGAVISHTNITDRVLAETEHERLFVLEKEARYDAEAANRTRDEFLATVSHELRNPLNAMLGWARLLQKDQLDSENKQKAVETIVRNAEAQNRLIEDLLDVSRIITGKLRLDISTINPGDFVKAAIDTVRPAAEAKNIRIAVSIDEELNKISGDANRLQQVVWNLLSNAIKFTPKFGEVKISVETIDSMIEIRVQDNGAGISANFLPHVFDRFRQADASTIRKFGGLGLGLAIVRHITEMHGGTVEVFSAGEGEGSIFTVKLPITAVTVEAEQVLSTNEAEAVSMIKAPNISLKGLFILTVDDEPDTCQLLAQVLTHYGAQVKTSLSAAEAMAEFLKQTPDILISDIGMPEEDGYSLIQKIRALPNDEIKKMPAIALTAFARPQDRMKALAAGFQTHVSKPVEPDELATVIASLTGRLLLEKS